MASEQNESTPLMQEEPSAAGGNESSYYFLERSSSRDKPTEVTNASFTEAEGDTEEVIDVVPAGASSEEFNARPVVGRVPSSTSQMLSDRAKPGFFSRLFRRTKQPAFDAPAGPSAPIGSMVKQRKVPIKVEPKVFFANERTFLAWLHTSLLLAGASIAIIAFAESNPWSQLYGIILLPVSIAFISYAMYMYARRAAMIRRRDPGPYEDTVGPTVLGIMLMLSIVAQFAIKLYSVL